MVGDPKRDGCGKIFTDTRLVFICCYYSNIVLWFFCFSIHLQISLHDCTYAICGFAAILDQAIEQLGYDWDYDGHLGQYTTEGWQCALKLTDAANGRSVGYIYGRSRLWRCEPRESAVIRALSYIDDDCGYKIKDIHFHQWL